MSNVLSYSNKNANSGNTDWIPASPYTTDEIRQIKDPNGGFNENPRTAIPSPFAQLDLVKNAFEHLANNQLAGTDMDLRLVSNALDVAQLFFDFENHRKDVTIVRWNRDEQLAKLKSDPTHRLYGETLELFLNSDTKYNFDKLTDWYILKHGSEVLGATSPASFVMAAPATHQFTDIMVEQNVPLFSTIRHLWQRDDDFTYCMFLLFNGYPSLRQAVGKVYAYMYMNLQIIKQQKPALYARITAVIPDPMAFNADGAAAIAEKLEQDFEPFAGDNEVTVLGARLYHKRLCDIRTQAAKSDFVIVPTRAIPADETLPLVLRNNFNGSVDHYRYIDKEWDSSTQVLSHGAPIDKRELPGVGTLYPFLTTADFLTDTIIQLSSPIDSNHFFDGNITSANNEHGYLLPIKPVFFHYFNAADLNSSVLGRPIFEIREAADAKSVTVVLRIPVRKKYIELTRTYNSVPDPSWTFSEERGTGRIVNSIMSAAVFPFVRTGSGDTYTVQLSAMVDHNSLRFFGNGMTTDGLDVSGHERTKEPYSSTYYDVKGSFDFIEATVNNDLGSFSGIIVPLWRPYTPSSKEYIFAVDFGTTNSHVEWAERGQESQPLTFKDGSAEVLIATLHKKGGNLAFADQIQRVEFLPSDIDSVYGFPLRTTLARNSRSSGNGTGLFSETNIPFLYERQYFSGYDVTTNIKWSGDKQLSMTFLREIILLIRAKVLIENADLAKTRVIYFFPVSMSGSDRSSLQDTWETLYRDYISDQADNLRSYPESIAPAYYYHGAEVTGSSFASIDIGGGTTDVVIYQPTDDRMSSKPVAVSSFRFAGNAIFGDAFNDKDADNNPLLQHYTAYFKKLIGKNADITYLNSILEEVMAGKRSEDINAFLFSIENVEQLRKLREIDRNLYSYNALLHNDSQRKLVFMYFYAAIIYYIASQMKATGLIKPKRIYFSGTGSKILNILGNLSQINEFTQLIIEKVFGESYTEGFEIKIEANCPKQITCRGGVRLENKRLDKQTSVEMYSPRNINAIKSSYSMIADKPQLTFGDVNDIAIRQQLVDSAQRFNEFFIGLCDKDIKDEFGIDHGVFNIFTSVVGNDMSNYLTAGITSFLHGHNYSDTDELQDVPFFYPITGVIRYNLLKNLCNDVISRANN